MKKLLFLLILLAGMSQAQTTVAPFLTSNPQFFTTSGLPNSGGCVFTYSAGTLNALATYSESTGTSLNSNPILLNSAGFATSGGIWFASPAYKVIVKTAGGTNCSTGSVITTSDGITWSTPLSTFSGLISTGDLTLQQSTAATSGANQSSNNLKVQGTYWTGAVSANDTWTLADIIGTGSNPTSTLTLTHSGSSGAANFSVPGNQTVGGTLGVTGLATFSGGVAGMTISLVSRDCRIDGTLDTTGVSDSSATINTCIANAVTNHQANIQLPCGQLKINTALNLTNRSSLTFSGCGTDQDFASSSSAMTQLLCNTGGICIDTTGSSFLTVQRLNLRLATTYSTPSNVGIMMGRDNAAGGGNGPFCFAQFNHFHYLRILADTNSALHGSRGVIGIYNIGAEHFAMEQSWIQADTPLFFSSSTSPVSIGSPYQTLQTGCAASMSVVTLKDTSLKVLSWQGVEINAAQEFNFANLEVIHDPAATSAFSVFLNGNTVDQIRGSLHVETPTFPNGGVVLDGATNVRGLDLDINVGGSIGAGGGYVAFNAINLTLTDPHIRIQTTNDSTKHQFFSNSATGITISGGEIWLTTTANPQTASNVTLTGTYVHAAGFTDAQMTFGASSQFFRVDDTGTSISNLVVGSKITSYNGVSTVSGGVPSVVATVDLTGQTAAVGTTTLYAVPASGAGQYRISWDAKVTTGAANSSTLGALTITYTDPDGIVVASSAAAAQISGGSIATTATTNNTQTVLLGVPILINAKASTNIQYAMAYASNLANTMAYNLHIKVEAIY